MVIWVLMDDAGQVVNNTAYANRDRAIEVRDSIQGEQGRDLTEGGIVVAALELRRDGR